MSDKRFKKGDNLSCVDTGTGKSYYYSCNLVGLLNEQQATINKLKEENEQLEKGKMEALSLLGEEIDKNEQLEKDKAILKERLRECGMRVDKLLGNCR